MTDNKKPTLKNADKLTWFQVKFANRTASAMLREQTDDRNRSASFGKKAEEVTFADAVALFKPLGLTRKQVEELVLEATPEKVAAMKAANKASVRKGKKATPRTSADAKAKKIAALKAQLAELEAS